MTLSVGAIFWVFFIHTQCYTLHGRGGYTFIGSQGKQPKMLKQSKMLDASLKMIKDAVL